jgi:hypothetical protein
MIISEYVERIKNNDPTLITIEIHISSSDISYIANKDIESLMTALANNPIAAQRITTLDIQNVHFSSINLQDLKSLEKAHCEFYLFKITN